MGRIFKPLVQNHQHRQLCMCKDGDEICKNPATKKVEILPQTYFYMCEKHYLEGGEQIIKRANDLRLYIYEQVDKGVKERRAKMEAKKKKH